jgi:hypothetical protein
MRIAWVAALVGAVAVLALPAGAPAAVTGQTLSVTASDSGQPKQQFESLGTLAVALDTSYSGPFTPNATQTVISFTKDFLFSPGGLPQCNLSAINTVPQAQADAICGSSKVGTGSASINGGLLTGVVAAYNGTPSGGSPTIGLHVDIFTSTGSYAFSTTLTGVLNTQANTLTVSIPPTGTSITHFGTTINQVRTGASTYYVMARCSTKNWANSQTTTFDDGQQLSASSSQRCQQTAPSKQGGGKKPTKPKKKKRGPGGGPPKDGTYSGKTDQDAVATGFRRVQFTLKNGKVTLTAEPTLARGLCLTTDVFTEGGTPTKRLSRNRTFTLAHTFFGTKIDKIHGRWVNSTQVEGYAVYNFFAQDLCTAGATRVNFKAKRQ